MRTTFIFLLLSCLASSLSAQHMNFSSSESKETPSVLFVGIDDLLNDQSRYLLQSKWPGKTVEDLNKAQLESEETLVVTQSQVSEGVRALVAFKGASYWAKEARLTAKGLAWKPSHADSALAVLYVNDHQLIPHLAATQFLGLRTLIDWAETYSDRDDWASMAYSAEFVSDKAKLYINAADVRKPKLFETPQIKKDLGIAYAQLIDSLVLTSVFKFPESRAYYLEQSSVQINDRDWVATKLYEINSGLQFSIVQEAKAAEKQQITVPYLTYLYDTTDPERGEGALDAQLAKRKAPKVKMTQRERAIAEKEQTMREREAAKSKKPVVTPYERLEKAIARFAEGID